MISNLKTWSSERRQTGNVLLLILDWHNFLMQRSTCLLDVEHLDMWLLRLSISKIWRQSMIQFAICSAWDWSFIFYCWESVLFLVRLTTKYWPKTEQATLPLKENNTKELRLKLWTFWWECSRNHPMKELQHLKLYLTHISHQSKNLKKKPISLLNLSNLHKPP